MKTINTEMQKCININRATKIGLKEVERLARQVLLKNPQAVCFTMAMGTFFFCKKSKDGDDPMWDWEHKKLSGYKKLQNFIEKWDYIVCLTGNPMTFTAKGKKQTNW